MIIFSILLHWIIPFYPRCRSCLNLRDADLPWILTGLLVSVLAREQPEVIRYSLPLMMNIAYADSRYMEIPDSCQFLLFLYAVSASDRIPFASYLIFIAGTTAALSGMTGFGDVKLIFTLSVLFRESVWLILLTASLSCLLVLMVRKKPAGQPVPFAPYICFGFLVTVFLL